MAVGLGLSIGTVNTVSALAQEGSAKAPPGRRSAAERSPAITRRTTLTFDSTGMARVGMIPRHGRAITEFADLTQRTTLRARVGHRALSSADLVAVVAECLITEARRDRRAVEAGIALTHPAGYTDDHLAELRAALDAVALGHVALIAEPVAAATWLEATRGPLMPGLALVYDLGGSTLDVTLVRVGAGCPQSDRRRPTALTEIRRPRLRCAGCRAGRDRCCRRLAVGGGHRHDRRCVAYRACAPLFGIGVSLPRHGRRDDGRCGLRTSGRWRGSADRGLSGAGR